MPLVFAPTDIVLRDLKMGQSRLQTSLFRPAAILATLAATAIFAPAAFACSCVPCDERAGVLDNENIDTVFVGELVSVTKAVTPKSDKYGLHNSDVVYRFRVLRSLKGPAGKYIDVRSSEFPSSCGATFTFQTPNAVAAATVEGVGLSTSSCTQLCWDTNENKSLIHEDTLQTWTHP